MPRLDAVYSWNWVCWTFLHNIPRCFEDNGSILAKLRDEKEKKCRDISFQRAAAQSGLSCLFVKYALLRPAKG
jgi:hypothetical protein